MKKIIQQLKYGLAAMLLVLATTQTFAQSITNGSFETLTTPGNYPSGTNASITKAKDWLQPTSSDPDYRYVGYTTYMGVTAQQGSAYVGSLVGMVDRNPNNGAHYGSKNSKEYFSHKLTSKLTEGVTYAISFYVRHPYMYYPGSAVNAELEPSDQGYLGLCFSDVLPTNANTSTVDVGGTVGQGGLYSSWNANHRALIPASNTSVYGTASRDAWVPVTLNYTADGTEEYMTVGQLQEGPLTGSYTSYGSNVSYIGYYLFDNFSMTAVSTVTPVATGTNPTTPTGTGSVSLSAATGSYPANTPVTVTYTKPDNTTATFTGNTDGTGKITIPNLPVGTYPGFVVSVNGSPASNPSNPVTLVAPPATPVPTGTNPTTPGGTDGSVSLSPPSGSSYPANTPVTVTYTRPDNTTATYSGSSDGTGKVTIPNLPAGTYTNFTVAFNGGAASGPSGPVTLSDCAANAGTITRQ
ncbi:hypothetical protein BWI96_05350 [Siphonobacter sp. SORGH_AS_0500]|uniref:hypothetical protein n=1 Tax=Siphonobacter sp. SORGH_AS_0500 TaxID=1864824 RepID=UPI000CB23A5A|nr:hypothetical protein [Siphonobacter sp. SORGH_AS_0500]PKK37884.1 hypothetical protein BWI96_05350 [Siphonobacter sp. SORGH_AS_0500]